MSSEDSVTTVLWKGEIFPKVSLLLGISNLNPQTVLYVLECDLVLGVPAQVLTGELVRLHGAAINMSNMDNIAPLIQGLYFDWVKSHYREELKHEYRQ